VIDIVITFIGISVLGFKDPMGQFIVKVIDNVIVIIANYVFSKWLIFKDNKQIEDQ
jgi:putative flippase GtrA